MNTGFAAGTFFLPSTIERFGRRKILMWSAFVLTLCMIVFVAMIGLPNPTLATQWTAVAAVIVYNFAFGYGWIGVCWLYGPEVLYQSANSSFTAELYRLHRLSCVTWEELLGPLESGSSPSSRSLREVLLWVQLAGRFGSGCCFPVPSPSLSCILCVRR